jgi:uncharacterized protein YjbI with pentapeptide repeats
MDGSLFYDCFLGFTAFVNADFTRATFLNNAIFSVNLAGTSLIQSSFVNNSLFLNINWTNTDLFQSNITNENLFGTTPTNLSNTNIILNTRFPNGSFLIDTSQLVINGGAEEEVNARIKENERIFFTIYFGFVRYLKYVKVQ